MVAEEPQGGQRWRWWVKISYNTGAWLHRQDSESREDVPAETGAGPEGQAGLIDLESESLLQWKILSSDHPFSISEPDQGWE